MGYCYTQIEQITELDSIDDVEIENFKKKYKDIVDLFEGEFLKKDSDGKNWILGAATFELNSGDLQSDLNRARVQFFEGADVDYNGEGEFSWGESGFIEKFYDDLAKLINVRTVEFDSSAVECGDGGYFTGSYSLWLWAENEKDKHSLRGNFYYYENGEGYWDE
jgi:hypothetical protein